MSEDLEEGIRKFALRNAVSYEGKASIGSVMGQIMGNFPEMRSKSKEIKELVMKVVDEINTLSNQEQKEMLRRMDPEFGTKKKEKKEIVLPDLENVNGDVVMRIAPGPSGPLHLGHTRMAILNDEYVKRYGGKLILRMEDTNPGAVLPEAYEMIEEDLKWLGIEYHEVVCQSDRFDIYLEYGEKLLKNGSAYMCDCDVEEWRTLKNDMKPCPHRDLGPEEHMAMWKKMVDGELKEGEVSYVVKTDLEHPNPAVRDFVAFRVVDATHPKTGNKYHAYPLYNFSVAIDDHLMGITHVLRGKDHLNNTYRQRYIYRQMGWDEPVFIHYGWVSIDDSILKTTTIKNGIKAGDYTGWDDVRLGTIRAMGKRGISPEAIRKYWVEAGINEVDIKFSWQNLYAYNKLIVDDSAKRLFFVWDPVPLTIEGVEELTGYAPFHPEHPEMGTREIAMRSDDSLSVMIAQDDASALKKGGRIRLKDLCNLEITDEMTGYYIGNDLSILKEGGIKIIHWAPKDSIKTTVHMPDGTVIKGVTEPTAKDMEGLVQFERFGFVKIENHDGSIEAYFAHK